MGGRIQSLARLPIVLALLAFAAGCAGGDGPVSLPDWLREEPRTIHIVVRAREIDPEFNELESRRGAGAAAGAGAGLVGWAEAAPNCSGGGEAGAVCAIVWLAMLPLVIVGGALVGAATAEPAVADTWKLTESELSAPLAAFVAQTGPQIADDAGEGLFRVLSEKGGHAVVLVRPAGDSETGEKLPANSDLAITVRLESVSFRGFPDDDPGARMEVRLSARVDWAMPTIHKLYTYEGRTERFSGWAQDGFRPVRDEFSAAAETLAGRIAAGLLGFPEPRPAP